MTDTQEVLSSNLSVSTEVFYEINVIPNMNETFYMEESARPPHPNNCPPGHSIAIANGGNGHWNGDGCCNESNPTANIDM